MEDKPSPTQMPARKPSSTPKSRNSTALTKASLIDRKALTEALALACILQKTYGKTPAELETLTDGFLWVLGDDFPVADIVTAIGRYCRRQPDLPAPADIANILDPRDPRLSTALYVELSRR